MTGIVALVEHLRAQDQAPSGQASQADLERLAEQFQVTPQEARQALQAVTNRRVRTQKEKPESKPRRDLPAEVTTFIHRYSLIIVLAAGSSLISTVPLANTADAIAPFAAPLFGSAFLASSFVASYIDGRFRVPLTAASLFAIFLLLIVLSMPRPVPNLGVIVIGNIFIAIIFATLVFVTALLGKVAHERRERRNFERLSRQELLERLFQTKEALAKPPEPVAVAKPSRVSEFLSRHVYVVALLTSVASSVVASIFYHRLDPEGLAFDPASQAQASPVGAIALALSFLSFVLYVFVGYWSRSWRRVVPASILLVVGGYASAILDLPPLDRETLSNLTPAEHAITLALIALTVSFGVLLHQTQTAARKALLRQANDPTVLLADLVELEDRLRPPTVQVAVLVVDVAGSTAMKRDADPYDAEYSFREYQNLVAHTAAAHQGRVESTAGDGAVISFPTVPQALDCAREIHTRLPALNQTKNRLASPFRLRMGLHFGEVRGDLGEVQFTRVIDVAAHVEATAPVGGLALTQEAVNLLPPGIANPTRQEVDGHPTHTVAF